MFFFCLKHTNKSLSQKYLMMQGLSIHPENIVDFFTRCTENFQIFKIEVHFFHFFSKNISLVSSFFFFFFFSISSLTSLFKTNFNLATEDYSRDTALFRLVTDSLLSHKCFKPSSKFKV